MEGSGPGGEESLSSSSCGTTASLNEDTPNNNSTQSTTACPPTPPPEPREQIMSSVLDQHNDGNRTPENEQSNTQLIHENNKLVNGHTNPGFEDDNNSKTTKVKKLYVTRDQRKSKGCGRKLCWAIGLGLLAAAVIVAILAATGVILTQEEPILKEPTEASGRSFNGNTNEPRVGASYERNGVETSVEVSSHTPPPSSTTSPPTPTTDMTMLYVPRTLEGELVLDEVFNDALFDSNSKEFKDLASILEDKLLEVLFDYQTLKYGYSNIQLKVQSFSPGSIRVKYRIGWTFKEGIQNPRDPIDADKVRMRFENYLRQHGGMISTYNIRQGGTRANKLINSCELSNGGCSHNCIYNYKDTLDFECMCPEGMILDQSGKNCTLQEITSSSTTTTAEPFTENHLIQSSSESELMYSTSSTTPSTTTTTTTTTTTPTPSTTSSTTTEEQSLDEFRNEFDNKDEEEEEEEEEEEGEEDDRSFPIIGVVTETQTLTSSSSSTTSTTTTEASEPESITKEKESLISNENIGEGRHFGNLEHFITTTPSTSTTSTPDYRLIFNETESDDENIPDFDVRINLSPTTTTSTTTSTMEPDEIWGEPMGTKEPMEEMTTLDQNIKEMPTIQPKVEFSKKELLETTLKPNAVYPTTIKLNELDSKEEITNVHMLHNEQTTMRFEDTTNHKMLEKLKEIEEHVETTTTILETPQTENKSLIQTNEEEESVTITDIPSSSIPSVENKDSILENDIDIGKNIEVTTNLPVITSTTTKLNEKPSEIMKIIERDREETTMGSTSKKPNLENDQMSEINPIETGTTEGVYITTTFKMKEMLNDSDSENSLKEEDIPTTMLPSFSREIQNISEMNNLENESENPSLLMNNKTITDPDTMPEHEIEMISTTLPTIRNLENDELSEKDEEKELTTIASILLENADNNTETNNNIIKDDISTAMNETKSLKDINSEITTMEPEPEMITIENIMRITTKNLTSTEKMPIEVLPTEKILNELLETTLSEDSEMRTTIPTPTQDMDLSESTTLKINNQNETNDEFINSLTNSRAVNISDINISEENNTLVHSVDPNLTHLSSTTSSNENITLPPEFTTNSNNLFSNSTEDKNESMSVNSRGETEENISMETSTLRSGGIFEIDPFTGELYRKSTSMESATEEILSDEKLNKKEESVLEKEMKNKPLEMDISHEMGMSETTESSSQETTLDSSNEASEIKKSTTIPSRSTEGITGKSIEIVTEMSPEKMAELAQKVKPSESKNITSHFDENDIHDFILPPEIESRYEEDEPNNIEDDDDDILKNKKYLTFKDLSTSTEHISSTSTEHISSSSHKTEIEQITTLATSTSSENMSSSTSQDSVIEHITTSSTTEYISKTSSTAEYITSSTSEHIPSSSVSTNKNDTTEKTLNDIDDQIINSTSERSSIEHTLLTDNIHDDSSMEILEASSTEHAASLSKCPSGTWECHDKLTCIPTSKRCDSNEDCSDGSDEIGCASTDCQGNFQCMGVKGCISRHLVCNGIADCPGNGDEKNCEMWHCNDDEFKCTDGPCIPLAWKCDGKADCSNGMDEINCNSTCDDNHFHCSENRCIPLAWRCDGTRDCSDGEDEISCRCGENQWRCTTGGGCISITQRCDGIAQCADLSDEWSCLSLNEFDHNNRLLIRSGNTTWHPVCADDWTSDWSRTACQALGYGRALSYTHLPLIGADTTSVYALTAPPAPEGPLSYPSPSRDLVAALAPVNTTCQAALELSCDEFMCGSQEVSDVVAGRFVGGIRTANGQWPWVALLLHATDNSSCTGSIISPKWILTSYNCLHSSDQGLNARSWVLIGGGALGAAAGAAGDAQIREVGKIVPYPQVKYSHLLYTHDIALIELVQPLEFNRFVGAICLPERPIETLELCVTAGWNRPPGESGLQQYYLPVPTIDRSECNSTRHYSGMVSNHQICAGYYLRESDLEKQYVPVPTLIRAECNSTQDSNHLICDAGKSPCRDEGAPLMCVKEGNVWELQGVLSYQSNCGKGFHPSIYTSVPPLKEWIKNTVGGFVPPQNSL